MKNIESKYLSIGEAADMLGLSVVTLRRYEKSGKLKSKFRTFGLHRRYDIEDISKLINPNKESKNQRKSFAMLVYQLMIKKKI